MTPAQAQFRYLWRRVAVLYADLVTSAVLHRIILPDSEWLVFQGALLDVFRWAGIMAAAAMRWQALHERTYVQHPTLAAVQRTNVWVEPFLAQTDELYQWRARKIAEVERAFLIQRGAALRAYLYDHDRDQRYHPLYRLERMRRDAIGEVQNTAEQVQLSEPEISDAFTHAVYLSRDDTRVRPTHAAMHRFVAWRGWEHWPICRPKCGFNCRCYLRFVSRFEAVKKGWASRGGRILLDVRWPNSVSEFNFNAGKFPDKGFDKPRFWAWPKGLTLEKAA